MAIEVTNNQPVKLAAMEGLWTIAVVCPLEYRRLGRRPESDDVWHQDSLSAEYSGVPEPASRRAGFDLVSLPTIGRPST